MADGPPPFYLVWRQGGDAPVREHTDYDSAKREARRLASQLPGSKFFVLTPSMSCVSNTIVEQHFDDLPF